MRKYIVHYLRDEKYWTGSVRDKRTIIAESSEHALDQLKEQIPDSHSHIVCEVYTRAA